MREENKEIAKYIHYPECWDDVAYPTLASALWEMVLWDEEKSECPICEQPMGNTSVNRENRKNGDD